MGRSERSSPWSLWHFLNTGYSFSCDFTGNYSFALLGMALLLSIQNTELCITNFKMTRITVILCIFYVVPEFIFRRNYYDFR